MLKTHETLLRDTERDRKFYKAIERRVTPGASVLDIGAGTGIWAILAAKLGASRVVAVDMDELLVGVIRMLADEHGVSDRVEAVWASSFDLQAGLEFDLIVSETIGYLGYDEKIVEVMADARKRFLREGGHIIPESISLYAAAGEMNVHNESIPAGVDLVFDALERLNLNSPRVLKRPNNITLLTDPGLLITTDLRRAEHTPALRELSAGWDLRVPVTKRRARSSGTEAPFSRNEANIAERINCVIVWVESRLAPGVNLSTRERTTSWLPTVYRISPASEGFTHLRFDLALTPETNRWTATFIDGDRRQTRSFSPELAAMEMVAAARGLTVDIDGPHLLAARGKQPPAVIQLRCATPEDQPFLDALYRTTRTDEVATFGWTVGQQESFLTMQFGVQQASYAMQYPKAEHSVILCDGVAAGRWIVNRSSDAVTLIDIAILPEFQGRGVASTLLKRLQTESAEITLSVDKQNSSARRLYETHGFVVDGENEFTFVMRWKAKV